jgi:glycosyltransferase involved in cell wall biosynthesis
MNKNANLVKVLHFSSTVKDNCGIGTYQEACLAAMPGEREVQNKFFEISPYQTRVMSPRELDVAMAQLKKELKEYDVLHIQHEFGLYWSDELVRMVDIAKSLGKKVVITVHLSPSIVKELDPVRLRGLGPHSMMAYLRQYRHHRVKMHQHILPMRRADMLIVHNTVTKNALAALGVDPARIELLQHPVYPIVKPPVTHDVEKWLNKKQGDIILCMVGFLHRYKGVPAAVEALKYLPKNYKLLLAGGVKSDSDEMSYEDKVTDRIYELGLQDRVHITGYVRGDEYLNSIIRECDICVYPYDKVYYSSASSGALGLAFTNCMPIVAYPTESLKEAAKEVEGAIVLTEAFAYYELAREVRKLDLKKQSELSREYAEKFSWPKVSKHIVELYRGLLTA